MRQGWVGARGSLNTEPEEMVGALGRIETQLDGDMMQRHKKQPLGVSSRMVPVTLLLFTLNGAGPAKAKASVDLGCPSVAHSKHL